MPQTAVRLFREADGRIPLTDWLDNLEESEPKAFRKCLQRILLLEQFGYELRRPLADTLRDGIYELRIRHGNVHYRILYFFFGPNLACLSHGLTKEGKVPDADIDLAVKRKKLVQQNPDKYTAEWGGG
jgi:phage-related protein